MPKRLTPRGEAAPPVEPIITGAKLPPKPVKKRASKPKKATNVTYIRNLHHIQASIRLTGGREIGLEPRGQREDIGFVNKDEREDPTYLANLNLLFEEITRDQAEEIISKQQTNAKREHHPLWNHLRNEKGQAYDQRAATIEEVFERQGVVVGRVEETGAGRYTDKNFQVTRTASPTIVEVPGSAGHPATEFMHSVPGNIDPEEYHEFLLWKRFKEEAERLAAQSPEEVRDALNVSIEPTQVEDDSAEA